MRTRQPKISIKPIFFDRVIDLITLLGVMGLVALPLYYFSDLSETLPSNTKIKGDTNFFSFKNTLWTIPIVNLIFFIGFTILKKHPYLFNYPVKVTETNAVAIYSISVTMLSFLGFIITLAFLYIEYHSIHLALGNHRSFGTWFFPSFIISMLGAIMYPLLRMNRITSKIKRA
jgi:hypothetical protein